VAAATPAHATEIGFGFDLEATDFVATVGNATPPYSSVVGHFAIAFDNSDDVAPAAVSYSGLNIALSAPLKFTYSAHDDIVFIGTNLSYVDGCPLGGGYDSFCIRVINASTNPLPNFVGYATSSDPTDYGFRASRIAGTFDAPGETPENPLLPTDPAPPGGGFSFTFTPTEGAPTFIDPLLALGYDYQITAGNNAITEAIFPLLAGDADGYTIYALGDLGTILGTVLGGQSFTFAAPVQGFTLGGIDAGASVVATDPTAFVTGLTFANTNVVTVTQVANPTLTAGAVPESGSWAMMIAGFALAGAAVRRRNTVSFARV